MPKLAEWLRGWCCDDRRLAQSAKRIPPFPGAFALEQAIDAQGNKTVQRSQVSLAIIALMLFSASSSAAAAPKAGERGVLPISGAVVSGIVRVAQGVAHRLGR